MLKGASETVQNEARVQKGGLLSMLLSTLGASLLGNILAGRGMNRACEGVGEGGCDRRSSKIKKNEFLMPPHPLTNFEIQKYYQDEPRFNGVYSRDIYPK